MKRNRGEPLRSVTYFSLIRDVGTVDWYTGVPIAENAAPKYFVDAGNNYIPNPDYRGEIYSPDIEDMKAESEFRPNSIILQLDIRTPGTVVINQNYHRDWHTDKGELFDNDGLIGLRSQEAGSYSIRMKYIPRSFYAGLTISILSLSALVFVCWAYMTERLLRWSQSTSLLLKRGSQALLWLID